MNANVMKTNNGKRLIAAIAIFAMIACIFAIAAPANADGAVTVPTGADPITDASDISADMETGDYVVESGTTIEINDSTQVPTGVTIYVQGTFTVSAEMAVDGSVIFLNGSNLTMNGHNYFGTSGYIQPTEGASLTVKSNANDGYDLVLDGTANVTTTLPIWASETFTITTGSTLNVSGTMTFNGLFTNNGTLNIASGTTTLHDGQSNLVNNGIISISSGATLNVDNATGNLRNNGTVYNNGTVTNSGAINNYGSFYNNATITNSGTIYNAGQLYSNTAISGVSGSPITNGFGISNNMDAIETNLDLTGYAFLTSDLTIPENKSITVGSNATLDLRGYTLTVEGELIIEMGGVVIGYDGDSANKDNAIVLSEGTISNEGTIGSGQVLVKVGVDQNDDGTLESYVELLNVEGISFGTTTVGASKTVYLTVTGDVISAVTSSDNYAFDMYAAYIVGEMTISDDIKSTILSGNAIVSENATLTIDGTVTGEGEIQMLNSSTVNVMGTCGVQITAATGKAAASNYTAPGITTVTLTNVTGITLSVTSTSSVETVGDESVRFTTRVLNISGAVDLIDDSTTGSIDVDNADDVSVNGDGMGIAYVSSETMLSIPEDVDATLGGTVVYGTVEYVDNNSVTEFVGTQYSIREGTTTTYYIQSFTGALGQIANAYRNTLYVSGPVEVTEDFTLTDGQTVSIVDTTYGNFTISTDATVTVEAGARISGTIEEVEGILTLQRGAPDAVVNKYAVYTENNGTRTYSGFAAAIANSNAGDTITVIGQGYDVIDVEGNVTIPSDRIVIVQKNMTFDGNLVIDEGATLNNQATITMTGQRSTITVDGTMDNSDSIASDDAVVFSVSTDNVYRGIYVNGHFIVDELSELALGGTNVSNVHAFVNGAFYTDNDGNIVVTTFANSVAAMSENDIKDINIIGTIDESGDVTVGNGEDDYNVTVGYYENGVMNLPGYATLGNITLNNAVLSTETGYENNNGSTITAVISGAYGIEGTTSVASVSLNEAGQVVITNIDGINNLAETYWYNTITSFIGAATVTTGEFQVTGTTYTVSGDNTLTVSSGATLIVPSGTTMNVNENVSVEGTLSIEGTLAIDDSATSAQIDGTIDIAEGGLMEVANGEKLTIVGALNIDADGTARVVGTLFIGETPETLGAVGTSAAVDGIVTVTGKIIAYSGANLDNASIMTNSTSAAKSTAYTINGIEYATIYGIGTIVSINEEISELSDLSVPNIATSTEDPRNYDNDIVWFSGETEVGVNDNIGSYASVSTEIEYESVGIVVSIGTHITVSIDNVIVNTTNGQPTQPLTIGTHTITAVVDPGYSGEITILFNGETVTNGQLVITSDMIGTEPVLSVSGTLTQDSTVVIDGGNQGGSSDMGLTDYLLIILVILIVVMAIIVALRLMRS